TNDYKTTLQIFLLQNKISQKPEELFAQTKNYVMGSNVENQADYFIAKKALEDKQEELTSAFTDPNKIEIKNYINLIETFIHESELTVGFFIRGDIERYT